MKLDFFVLFALLYEANGFTRSPVVLKTCSIKQFKKHRANKDSTEEERAVAESRPPVIPFDFKKEDFAKPDILITPPKKEIQDEWNKDKSPPGFQNRPLIVNDQSTGYNNDDDDDPNWVPSVQEDVETSSPVFKFLKDVYIGTEYDSKQKKQARYAVRNITGISIAIGLVFTAIWYAFPGKFISYKGEGYISKSPVSTKYSDPNELLKNGNDIPLF